MGIARAHVAILALNSCSLLLLLLDGELSLDLLLLLKEFVQTVFSFFQLLFELLFLWRVRLRLAELFETTLDLLILIIDKLGDLLQSQRWVLARIIVLITLRCLHYLQVFSGYFWDDVYNLRFRM